MKKLVCPEHGEVKPVHLCDSCKFELPTCVAGRIVWGIDVDPSARGEAADMVLSCEGYVLSEKPQFPKRESSK